jgi:uncharacterized protein
MTVALLEALNEVALVDHHAHGIVETPATLDAFRGLFSESPDPRQWPHVATGLTYMRAIGVLADLLGCEATEEAVYERRRSSDPDEYAAIMLRATHSEWLLIDEGFPAPGHGASWEHIGRLAACKAAPVLRIETVGDQGITQGLEFDQLRELVRTEVGAARGRGYVAVKTVAAYRSGLDVAPPDPRSAAEALAAGAPGAAAKPLIDLLLHDALEVNAADPLPVQVHCGFGDSDLMLPRADPGHLKPLIERFAATPFVLLHNYPFVREAGWLAHVYANVFFDLSLTIPFVARPAAALAESLELAPVSKLLYASDAARTPELYLLAATWWRDALADVLPDLLPERAVERAARMILRDNARRVYRV